MRFKILITILALISTLTFFCIGCSKNELCKNISNMNNPRANHYSFLLNNGKVLLLGGGEFGSDSIELYNPDNNSFKVIYKTNDMRYAKAYLLNNSNVLIILNNEAFIYQYKKDLVSKITTIPIKIDSFIQLKDETFLFSNGVKAGIYNAINDKFHYVGDVKIKRSGGDFFPLKDGNVIFGSGSLLNAKTLILADDEFYNAKKQEFQLLEAKVLDNMPLESSFFDNSISLDNDNSIRSLDNQIEINNRKTGETTIVLSPVFYPSLIKLKDGNILIVGGQNKRLCDFFKPLSSIYLYKTKEKQLVKVGNLNHPRSAPGLVQLKNGNILVTGGQYLAFYLTEIKTKKSAEILLLNRLANKETP